MNIKRAKQEIIHTIHAYLEKDEAGHYRIPALHQRPVLLMGPPGIGKTQIMEQIAGECDLALVSYTITHHTRQSAIGLPFIREKEYGGVRRSVTEYTMSEIIASMYDRMEESGKREGILFIDEINCVSETLAPAMLQFLQGKSFGNQKVPEGWIIVAAGNPAEYNKSVREFDVVTLDRVKLIRVEADYGIWKEFAYEAGIHGSILSYLDIRKEQFYRIETTVDGKRFVTARGWQDLSEMLFAYERMGVKADREVTGQYLQHPQTAKDFANYLELYYKYQEDYRVDEILTGTIRPGTLNKLKFAPFDERLEVVGLLLSKISQCFRSVWEEDRTVGRLYELLKEAQTAERTEEQSLLTPPAGQPQEQSILTQIAERERAEWKSRLAAGQNEKELRSLYQPLLQALEEWIRLETREQVREAFNRRSDRLEEATADASSRLEYAFDFMEQAFGEGQEMIMWITELSVNRYAVWFLQENPCDRYFMYNKSFLFDDREAQIRAQLDQIREMQIT